MRHCELEKRGVNRLGVPNHLPTGLCGPLLGSLFRTGLHKRASEHIHAVPFVQMELRPPAMRVKPSPPADPQAGKVGDHCLRRPTETLVDRQPELGPGLSGAFGKRGASERLGFVAENSALVSRATVCFPTAFLV